MKVDQSLSSDQQQTSETATHSQLEEANTAVTAQLRLLEILAINVSQLLRGNSEQ